MEPRILVTKHYSHHQDDQHLEYVLAMNFKDEFVTWMHNKQDGGFYYGHYHGKDLAGLKAAIDDFERR